MTSTNTLTLVEGLTRIADAAKRPDGTDSPLSEELRSAISALEAAEKALEPFAEHERRLSESEQDGFVAHTGAFDRDDLRLARSVHSMLIGEDKTKGDIKEANHG